MNTTCETLDCSRLNGLDNSAYDSSNDENLGTIIQITRTLKKNEITVLKDQSTRTCDHDRKSDGKVSGQLCKEITESVVDQNDNESDKISGGRNERINSQDTGSDESARNCGTVRAAFRYVSSQRGIFITLLSAFLQSLVAMGIAYLSDSVGPNQITFARLVVQLMSCSPLVVFHKIQLRHFPWTAYTLLFLRATIGSINSALIYYCFQIMPVGSAKSIHYTSSVFAGLFGWVFLKESCSLFDTLLSVVTLGGVVLVAQPEFLFGDVSSIEPASKEVILGSFLSLLVAMVNALIFILMRKMGAYGMSPFAMLFGYGIIGIPIAFTLTSVFHQWTIPKCGWERIIMLGNGVMTTVCLVLIFIALKTQRASTVSIVHSSDIMFSFILEYLIYGIVPSFLTIIGAVVIVSCVVGMSLKQWWVSRKKLDDDGDDEEDDDIDDDYNEHVVVVSREQEDMPRESSSIRSRKTF